MICDKKEIGERPTLEQLTIRIWQKRLNVSARRMFDFYERKEWMNSAGEPLKDLDASIGRFGSFEFFKRKSGELKEEKALLQNTVEWRKYTREVHQFYHDECQRCGKTANLEVHHKFYYYAKGNRRIPARLPWEYPMENVLSLCHACHEKEQKVKYYSEHEKLSGFQK